MQLLYILRMANSFRQSVQQEYKESTEFYLSPERKQRLTGMGFIRRTLWTVLWLLKELVMRLNPVRRALFLAGLFFLFFARFVISTDSSFASVEMRQLGAVIIIFILLLELKDKEIARDELSAGSRVQAALAPEPLNLNEPFEIWLQSRPANEVGGDLVDYIVIDENSALILLGDVSGKGLAAALLLAKLQSTFRALVKPGLDLSELSSRVNSILYRDIPAKAFASCLILSLSRHNRTIQYVNAGHLPLLLIGSGKKQELRKGQPAFGLLKEVSYEKHEIILEKDEWLAGFSDGLTEVRNEYGAFLPETEWLAILENRWEPEAALKARAVFTAVDYFRGNARIHDDQSLLIIQHQSVKPLS